MSWLPWRGPSPVRWTLALALCVVAVIAAWLFTDWRTVSGRPADWRNVTVPAPAAWAALLALLLALLAIFPAARERGPWVRPWRGPEPVRNTVAFALMLLAAAVVLLDVIRLLGDRESTAGLHALVLPVWTTLVLASNAASTRRRRGDVVLWAFFTGASWALYVSYLR